MSRGVRATLRNIESENLHNNSSAAAFFLSLLHSNEKFNFLPSRIRSSSSFVVVVVGENENFLSVRSPLGVLIYDGGGGEAEKKGKKCLSNKMYRKEREEKFIT